MDIAKIKEEFQKETERLAALRGETEQVQDQLRNKLVEQIKTTFQSEADEVAAAFTEANKFRDVATAKFNDLLKKLEGVVGDDDDGDYIEGVMELVDEIDYRSHGYRDGFEFWLASDHCW